MLLSEEVWLGAKQCSTLWWEGDAYNSPSVAPEEPVLGPYTFTEPSVYFAHIPINHCFSKWNLSYDPLALESVGNARLNHRPMAEKDRECGLGIRMFISSIDSPVHSEFEKHCIKPPCE